MEIELWKLGSLLWGIVSAYVVILGLDADGLFLIFSFLWVSFPDIHIHLYQQLQQWLRGLLFLKSLAGCLFVALLPMMRLYGITAYSNPCFCWPRCG
ncbi:hypothetical protein QS34_11470 [Salmonella enterica subsp. enterica serovar Senftenberg]|nr:hypothetical protein QS34_11470 [Salmonella enterica subsp. enterica serovar Senftenberg]